LTPDSNYDQALLRWLFNALAGMALELKDEAAVQRWSAVRNRLEQLEVDVTGSLGVARGVGYDTTHRYLSHTLAVYPLGLLQVEDAEQKKVIDASLDHIVAKGTGAWKGFSFPWMACLMVRAGRGDEALDYLHTYQRGFLSRNGFHLGGDQSSGAVTSFRDRAFTIEGNALAMQAMQEMLLQSQGGLIRVFPACPEKWKNAAFEQLRVEGGHRVSAIRLGGRTKSIVIVAGSSGVIRLRDPFESGVIFWNADVVKSGDVYDIPVFKGETITASVLVWTGP
jgi:alpha-L-fucosidase 2